MRQKVISIMFFLFILRVKKSQRKIKIIYLSLQKDRMNDLVAIFSVFVL